MQKGYEQVCLRALCRASCLAGVIRSAHKSRRLARSLKRARPRRVRKPREIPVSVRLMRGVIQQGARSEEHEHAQISNGPGSGPLEMPVGEELGMRVDEKWQRRSVSWLCYVVLRCAGAGAVGLAWRHETWEKPAGRDGRPTQELELT